MNTKNRYLFLIILAFLKLMAEDISVNFLETHANLELKFHKDQHLAEAVVNQVWVICDRIHEMWGFKLKKLEALVSFWKKG